jgi:hypothetical protein
MAELCSLPYALCPHVLQNVQLCTISVQKLLVRVVFYQRGIDYFNDYVNLLFHSSTTMLMFNLSLILFPTLHLFTLNLVFFSASIF